MIYRSIAITITSALITSAIISVSAPAQVLRNHNSHAPVSFDAGTIEVQDRADRVVLSGGVTATQAGLVIHANQLTAAYSNGGGIDVHRLDALGGVTIAQDDLRASSNAAIYDLDSNLITLIGNVQLSQGANHLNGGRIVIDVDGGRSTISGGATTPAAPGLTHSGGRVTGTFTVPQRKN